MELNLTLKEEEVNVILQSLAKQPFEVVSGVIYKIQTQGNEQITKSEENKN